MSQKKGEKKRGPEGFTFTTLNPKKARVDSAPLWTPIWNPPAVSDEELKSYSSWIHDELDEERRVATFSPDTFHLSLALAPRYNCEDHFST